MKPLILGLTLTAIFPAFSQAEDLVLKGMRDALTVVAPVSDETSNTVRVIAAELLARHVKIHQGSFLSERTSGGRRMWMDMKGLHLGRVTGSAVSQADKANGIIERYFVSVDCEMFRTHDSKTSRWSRWVSGRNPFMPLQIWVIRDPVDRWTASSPPLVNLTSFTAKGNPESIPHEPKPAPARPTPFKSAPFPTTTTEPPLVSAQLIPVATVIPQSASWRGIVCLLAIIAAVSAYLNSNRRKKRSAKRQGSSSGSGSTPPHLPASTGFPQPPALPVTSDGAAFNFINLIVRKQTLMTAAEKSFFEVLEPLICPSCRLSSNVRLADLFTVRKAQGQQAAFNKIRSKHVDFVITETKTSRIVCAIELDDRSHNRPDRIERDTFVNALFASQKLPLLRVPFAWTYYPTALRGKLLNAGVPLSNAA